MARMAAAVSVAVAIRSGEAWARRAASVSTAAWRRWLSLRQMRKIVEAPMIRAAKGREMRKSWRPIWGRAVNHATTWAAVRAGS